MLFGTALLNLAMLSASAQLVAPSTPACHVTSVCDGSIGSQQLSTVGLWPNGTIVFRPGGPGFVTPNGSLGMKFG